MFHKYWIENSSSCESRRVIVSFGWLIICYVFGIGFWVGAIEFRGLLSYLCRNLTGSIGSLQVPPSMLPLGAVFLFFKSIKVWLSFKRFFLKYILTVPFDWVFLMCIWTFDANLFLWRLPYSFWLDYSSGVVLLIAPPTAAAWIRAFGVCAYLWWWVCSLRKW